jgi:predicted nucleic acid-binding protein
MARHVLVDTGPVVALLDRRDRQHEWAKREIARLHDPLLTCEAVISEVFFLLSRVHGGTTTFVSLLRDGLVRVSASFSFRDQQAHVLRYLERYGSVPMSFADACLVRMFEIDRDSIIFTTDRDFLTYRRNRRQAIPLISPFDF